MNLTENQNEKVRRRKGEFGVEEYFDDKPFAQFVGPEKAETTIYFPVQHIISQICLAISGV